MGVYGKTKGTELESFVNMAVSAESMGGMMYYALSDIAERFGLKDVVEQLTGLGNQEMRHAVYYATLNGKYPGDTESFWKVIHGIGKAVFMGGRACERVRGNARRGRAGRRRIGSTEIRFAGTPPR
ncbi:MAG: hypothetical protein J6S40_09840 [Thermoguttaceae bacterium]|nr:hypothetical protein [Thermoguttaceae bacterium]